ncbi:MAG: glycoside hydrolase family 9 protein [Bacteroidales bacterium]
MKQPGILTGLLLFFMLSVQLSGSDLIEVLPVTDRIIRLTFDDGYIEDRGTGYDHPQQWPLDLRDALSERSYFIVSSDDEYYRDGRYPEKLGRKSKIHDVSSVCDWDGQKCMNTYIQYHFIYLRLPKALVNGNEYTLKVANLADNLDEWSFIFDDKRTRSVALHTNHLGYSPGGEKRYAYISQWMGDLGPLHIDEYNGARFDIYPLNSDGSPGSSVYHGNITKQKDYETGGPDSDKSAVGPNRNFVKSDVWECDFSDFDTPGEYVIAVDSIGCSYPFRIHEDAYHEAFYYAARALYFERAVTALPEQYAGKYHRPEWTERKVVYTSVRTMDLTDESGKNQKQNIFDHIDYSFDLGGIRGWYHDAGDWDGYFSHFRVPRSLMHAYELAPDNFSDGELNIPETQAANGYTNTHIPDILDEAVWLVDYFKNNTGPTGGIFGSRVHPDISDRDGLSNASYHEGQGFVFEDDARSLTTSYNDYRTWIVHGEDPRDSYAFASIAAQYVHCLEIAMDRTSEDYSALMAEYRSAAENAYEWASTHTLAGDEQVKHFIENRAAAAAWLYKITGSQGYLDQLKADLSDQNINSSTSNLRESKWAVWAYVTIDETDPLYSGTFDIQLKTDLSQAVENYAHRRVLESIEDKNRSMRMGGDFSQPVWNGQATTPWILPAMVAYRVTGSQNYLDACYLTGDYFLGGNQLNYTWLTGVGHEHPIHILHNDSRHDDLYGNIPGVPPYSPRTRCDWMSFQGNNCDYQGPWDNDFFLLDGRIYPSYEDGNGNTQWPVHELWFDQYTSPAGAEFTVHQTIAPAAAAYGFLCAPGGTATKNESPSVNITIPGTEITEGDELEIQLTASDPDGWIYKTELYQNNRLVKLIDGRASSIVWENVPGGTRNIFVKVTDNMGRWSTSDTLSLDIMEYANAPSIDFDMDGGRQYGITGRPVLLEVTVTGDADTVSFYNFYEPVGLTHQEPFDLEWTPLSEGEFKIRAVAYNSETGLSDQDQVFFSIRDKPFLLDLSASVLELKPPFDPDIVAYTIELPGYINDVPPLFYESVKGSTTTLQEALGIDQRVYVDQEDRTTVIRVEEEGNPENYTEYRVTFRLKTGAEGECYSTLRSLALSTGELDYDPDVLTYQVELDTMGVPEVTYAPTNEEASVTVQEAVSVDQRTHPDPADRTTTITVANCGEETSYQIIFTTTATGIRHMENSEPVIYPNPANDFIHLKGMDRATKLEIYDIMGTMVKSVIPDDENSGMLNISELPGGLYVIRVFAGEQMTGAVKFSKSTPPR